MISLYRILKAENALNDGVTSAVLQELDAEPPKIAAEMPGQDSENKRPLQRPYSEILMEDAVKKAEDLLERARIEAEEIKKDAFDQGYQEGMKAGEEDGKQQAYEEHQEALRGEIRQLEEKIGQYVEEMHNKKEQVLEEYMDDLKNISLAIGEKIVQTSLKSSSEVVKRMILAATEKLKKTAWAKIYVAKTNEELNIQGDMQLLKELAKLSDNVKIVVMEEAEPGTCIIELPQEIIDISAGTQLENIREILNNARL